MSKIQNKKNLLSQYQKYFLIAIPILIVGLLIYFFSSIFTYVVLGWILSLLGAPLFRLFNRFLNSTASSVLSLISMILVFSFGLWLLIPPIIQQTRNLAKIDYESMISSLDEPLEDWKKWLENKGIIENGAINKAQNELNNAQNSKYEIVTIDTSHGAQINIFIDLEKHNDESTTKPVFGISNDGENFVDQMKTKLFKYFNPNFIPSLFNSLVGFFGNLVITVLSAFFIAFFFLKEKGLFTRMIKSVIPNKREDQAEHAIEESENLLIRYFVGIALQVSFITLFLSISLRLLGFENALIIAFIAGLMNLIPYIGPIFGALFGTIITISSKVGVSFYSELLPEILILLGLFAVMQLIDNFILQPNIFSKSVKAHPLEIFIVVLLGARLGGIMGMVLAIPAYTIFRVIAKVFLSEFKIVQSITRTL